MVFALLFSPYENRKQKENKQKLFFFRLFVLVSIFGSSVSTVKLMRKRKKIVYQKKNVLKFPASKRNNQVHYVLNMSQWNYLLKIKMVIDRIMTTSLPFNLNNQLLQLIRKQHLAVNVMKKPMFNILNVRIRIYLHF